jgi:hypothetical protein
VRRKETAKIITITDVARQVSFPDLDVQLFCVWTTLAFQLYTHSKILVAIMNGPAVGLGAGMYGQRRKSEDLDQTTSIWIAAFLGLFDFVYATPGAWIAVPFHCERIIKRTDVSNSSYYARVAIGIAAEVNSTTSFVDKLGLGKANQVLYWGKKTPVEELLNAGFVKWAFGCSRLVLCSLFPQQNLSTFRQCCGAHPSGNIGRPSSTSTIVPPPANRRPWSRCDAIDQEARQSWHSGKE